mmetsp:Transcript_24756/g.17450  ORF Transcript_24756/g.17450 Transcript_24756/m.17450 type:complete len:83 (+) Transcript_24756:500-748(+)
MFNINVKGTFFLIKEFKDLLIKSSESASICAISSYLGKHPASAMGIHAMTKAALDNMVVWMADELRPDNIRVVAVAPGYTGT